MTIAPRKPAAILALALALAGLAGTAPLGARAGADSSSSPGSQVTTARALESPVLQLVNAERRKRGLRPLTVSRQLGTAAVGHARSMGRRGYFSHSSYDGTPPGTRIRHYFDGSAWGETLVWRAPELTPQEAFDMWMGSPPHREILMSPKLTEIGFGEVHVENGTGVYEGYDPTILVADLGRP